MLLVTLLNKTKRGEVLTSKEIDILAKKLKLSDSIFPLIIRIILTTLICVLMAIGLANIEYLIVKILIVILAIALILFIFFFRGNTKDIISYLDALKGFYAGRLCEYDDFDTILVQHQFMKNGYLQNSLAIFATDGYSFYIFDDLLKETKYLLPRKFKGPNNKRPALKVLDQEFVRKRPVCFEVNEIDYYQLLKPFTSNEKEDKSYGEVYKRYTYTISDITLDNYCLLVLKDGSSFKLAPDVVTLLRKSAKRKEKTGD